MKRLVNSLSWSKIRSWQDSKKQFIKTYFEKEPFFETKEIIFGSALGTMIELQEYYDEDKIVNVCMTWNGELQLDARKEKLLRTSIHNIKNTEGFIEKLQDLEFDLYSEYENKFEAEIGCVSTIGYSDNCSSDWKKLKEFKTGKTPWDENRVNEHGQLDLYCLLTYLEKGYLPSEVELIWFPTSENEAGEIIPTGEIKTFSFDVEKNKKRILKWEKKIPKIFKEIQEAQKEWEKSKIKKEALSGDFLLEHFKEYKELDINKKEIEEKQKAIKSKIGEYLKNNSLEDYKIEGVGSVYYTNKKTFEYDKTVKNAEAEYKKIKKEFEEKNNPVINSILTFKAQ